MLNDKIESYLTSKWVFYTTSWKEIVAHCIFNECDKDSIGKEAHLYINWDNWLFQCKKCSEKWNWITLLKHYGDKIKDYPLEWYWSPKSSVMEEPKQTSKKKIVFTDKDVVKYNKNITKEIREYLNNRWITDDIIQEKQLWYWSFYGSNWIVIPIRDKNKNIVNLKLRRDPYGIDWNKYAFYPGWTSAILYGSENLVNNDDYIVICEWEFDQMILEKEWILAITTTGWAGTFKEDWIAQLEWLQKIYVCYDNDLAGEKWMQELTTKLKLRYSEKRIYSINIVKDWCKDVSDYFMNWWNIDELMLSYSEETSGIKWAFFHEITIEDIINTLSLTIKQDNINKLIVFLWMLTAFTNDAQINILLNAPSASGKSFIPLEIAKLFPKDTVKELQYVSLSAFFHMGDYDEETNELHVDLERKVIIFIDQPRPDVLERLRPFLSHDKKILESHIVDKNGQWGHKTKVSFIHWFSTIIFCTASPKLDEQEATRMILLSPEISDTKIKASITGTVNSSWSDKSYRDKIDFDIGRLNLIERIQMVKDAHINDIFVPDTVNITNLFLNDMTHLKPRHQRDITKFLSIIKSLALLNFQNRVRKWSDIFANENDVTEAYKIWKKIQPEQEYGISPYLIKLYQEVFLPAYKDYGIKDDWEYIWIPRKYVISKHSDVYGSNLSEQKWRQQIEPSLINAWLISSETVWRNIMLSPTKNSLNYLF